MMVTPRRSSRRFSPSFWLKRVHGQLLCFSAWHFGVHFGPKTRLFWKGSLRFFDPLSSSDNPACQQPPENLGSTRPDYATQPDPIIE